MGKSIDGGKGAIDFIESRLRRNLPISLFHDEWRSCIDCDELADIVIELFSRNVIGLFHLGGPTPVSLYEIGKKILVKGKYDKAALKKWSRADDIHGPPRIGNVHLDSSKVETLLKKKIREWSLR
jgi:dTDP-4-dehydrorhamnose reductase